MPIYEYRCTNGHTFDVMQSMSDEPIAVCEVCSLPVERVFRPVAVHFKGSGFYTTDYGRNRSGAASPDSGKDESKSESKGESKGESKETTATKSEGSSGGGSSD